MLKKVVTDTIKKLDFPAASYPVFSGAVLAVHGIRSAADIDIVAQPDLFLNLKQSGEWKLTTRYEDDTEFLQRDSFEIASKLAWSKYPVTLTEAKEHEDMIDGVPFMSLEDVIQFKQAMGQDKDTEDIALIKKYVAGSS
jgi:hypothetical protein